MSNRPIDFSSIDPKRNEARWESMIHSVLERSKKTRNRSQFFGHLVSWAKPAITAAAAVALFCLIGAVARHTDSPRQTSQSEPALMVASWAVGEEMPNTADILTVLGLGEDHVRK